MSGGFRSPLPAPFFGGGIGAVPNIAPAGFRTPFPCWFGLVGSNGSAGKSRALRQVERKSADRESDPRLKAERAKVEQRRQEQWRRIQLSELQAELQAAEERKRGTEAATRKAEQTETPPASKAGEITAFAAAQILDRQVSEIKAAALEAARQNAQRIEAEQILRDRDDEEAMIVMALGS